MFSDLTVNLIVLRLVALLIVAPVHRLAVAGAAIALGDPGPKYDGEITVDPLRHQDLFGALGAILFGIGWSRAVAIDPAKLRTGRAGVVLVIAAGFVALLALAFVLRLLVTPALTMLPYSISITVVGFLPLAAEMCLWFALLSLIPIPPLTCSLLLAAFGVRVTWQVQWILSAVLLVVVGSDVVRQILGPVFAVLKAAVIAP